MTNIITSLVLGALGGVVSWFATDFIAQPLRRFFHLRGEIAARMIIYGNVRAPIDERGKDTDDFTDDDMVRLEKAQIAFRRWGARMLAFCHTEPIGYWLVLRMRYDPLEAGQSLIGLSNSIGVYGNERHQHRQGVLNALHIKDTA
jgi:hypothetical protein